MILVALIIVSVLLAICALNGMYRAGYREGFDAGFSAGVDLDDAEPPTHAELQAAAAREGRQ